MTNQAWSYLDALNKARELLAENAEHRDAAKREAEMLLCHVLNISRSTLYAWPERLMESPQAVLFFKLILRRQRGEPIAYILGEREFWGLNLKVTPDTLIPRHDTETLVEAGLEKIQKIQQPRVLDLGTGSGAVALAIAHERPKAQISAVDMSLKALAVAKYNAQHLGLNIHFYQGNWFEPIGHQLFDLIVSNPPYIEQQDPHLKQGDLRFEPITALSAGQDGLDDLRVIIHQAWFHLSSQGWLMVEHGYNQAKAVHALFDKQGYQSIGLRHDLNRQPRVTLGQKP